MACFGDDVRPDLFDREPFLFRHQLLGHPALEMSNLARMIPTLPDWQVHYSSGKLQRTDNFETAHREHANGMSIEETIETLKTSNSYIMIREPDRDGSFHPLYQSLMKDVHGVLAARGLSGQAREPKMYLFISSPDSVTPFHIDRYTNFLMQFQGSKQIAVFPQWNPAVMAPDVRESLVAYSGKRPLWTPEMDALATTFDFQPGDALHIPFVAGHHVRNGPNEVSISLSLFFKTEDNLMLTDAMVFNDRLRRLNLNPTGVGSHRWLDCAKSALWRTGKRASAHRHKLSALGAVSALGVLGALTLPD